MVKRRLGEGGDRDQAQALVPLTYPCGAEVDTKTGKKVDVGRIMLKGDAITLLQTA